MISTKNLIYLEKSEIRFLLLPDSAVLTLLSFEVNEEIRMITAKMTFIHTWQTI